MTVTGWDGITLAIEVAFTTTEFVIGAGIIGTTKLGPEPTWTDITGFVQGFSCSRGRQRLLDRPQTGTLRLELKNTDGRFDPTNLAGPYVSGGATLVTPGCPVRVRATYGATTYAVWRGFADAWPGTWEKGPASSAPAFARLEASGVFEWPAGADLPAGPAQGQGELAGARINRILDEINWPSFSRTIGAGVATLQDTRLEGGVVEQLQAVAESDGGAIYEGADGSIVFLDRQSPYTLARSAVSQVTFGDSAAAVAAGTEKPYADVTFDYSADTVKNDVILGRDGADTRVRLRDGVSRRKYGPKTYENTSLQNVSDAALVPLGRQILAQSATAELRFARLTLRPRRSPGSLWPAVLALDVHSRITIVRRPSAGNTITQDCFVGAVAHSVGPGSWDVMVDLIDAAGFTTAPFLIGSSLLGGADVLVA